MKQFLTVIVFSLLIIGFFDGFSNFGIPQIEPAPPPSQEKVDLGAMTMEGFIALGGRIFNGKGTCTLCHNNVVKRAPMLDVISTVFKERLADPRYKGEATDLESYLIESTLIPSAYVVKGFGKKGSNDTVSPMPIVTGGSIGLSEPEFLAVLAYIQDASGAEVTVEIPTDAGDIAEEEEDKSREALTTVEDIISEFDCGICHVIGEDEGEVGPSLLTVGASRDRAFIRKSILDPNADITEGFDPDTMPADLGATLYAQELELLLDYLSSLK